MLITEILAKNAATYSDKTALVERNPAENLRSSITWGEFDTMANRFSNALINLGVSKGDKVVQLMTNCLEWLPVYFGILKTGAWVVPLNFRFEADKIDVCTSVAEASVFVFGEEFTERVNTVKDSLDQHVKFYIFTGPESKRPEFALSFTELLASAGEESPGISLTPEDEAGLYFTSGTTGTPKAVLLTHRNLEFACQVENQHHKQTHTDNFLCIPPLYHTGAKMHWFGNFIVGAKSVILKGVSPKWILEAVSEEQITIVWLLVPWAHDILIALENNEINLNDYKTAQWRLMHIGAQPVPPSLIEKWKTIFPGHAYDTNYGLTEATGPGCVHLGMANTHKIGAIGQPGHGWECSIVNAEMEPLPGGETGELIVRGDGVMKAYYKNPDESKKVLSGGWLRTGDMARKDENGFIWLVDRKKDLIITGGENIFPVEIENFLITNDSIQDVAVIGLPDRRLGEVVATIIQLKKGKSLSEDEVNHFCESLPRYKRPRRIIFGDVPRNPTGKIEKPKLRRKYIQGNRDFNKLKR